MEYSNPNGATVIPLDDFYGVKGCVNKVESNDPMISLRNEI